MFLLPAEVIRNDMGRVIGISVKLGPVGLAIHLAYISDLLRAGPDVR